jgi:WD40 repeat protein
MKRSVVRCIKLSDGIVSLRVREDIMAVGVSKGIFVYMFSDAKIRDQLIVYDKWNGCMALSTGKEQKVLVWPHKQEGHIALKFYEDKKNSKETVVSVGSSKIVCISVNAEGTLIAVATEKGKMIRVYNPNTGELVQELRRGSYKCTVHQILFHKPNKYLLCTSNRKSVHIFMLKNTGLEHSQELLKLDPRTKNKTSK